MDLYYLELRVDLSLLVDLLHLVVPSYLEHPLNHPVLLDLLHLVVLYYLEPLVDPEHLWTL